MKKLLLVLLLTLFCSELRAGETLTEFDETNLVVLNTDLEKKDAELEKLNRWVSPRAPALFQIVGGVVEVTQSVQKIETETSSASDDLTTINGGSPGNVLILYAFSSTHTVVLKDGTGNLKLAGDCTLDNAEDTATLVKTGINWQLIACTNNGA